MSTTNLKRKQNLQQEQQQNKNEVQTNKNQVLSSAKQRFLWPISNGTSSTKCRSIDFVEHNKHLFWKWNYLYRVTKSKIQPIFDLLVTFSPLNATNILWYWMLISILDVFLKFLIYDYSLSLILLRCSPRI